jgi:hypothetical protein
MFRLDSDFRGVVDGVDAALFCIPDARLLLLLGLEASALPML